MKDQSVDDNSLIFAMNYFKLLATSVELLQKLKMPSFTVDGGWSSYGDWSECSAECDGGFQARTRHCNNPVPKGGGADCVGKDLETQACNTQQCTGNFLTNLCYTYSLKKL